MPNTTRKLFVLIILAVVGMSSYAQFYTGSHQNFGKNRVQYRDFNWLYFPYENFEVYFYQGGRDLAEYTLKSADNHLEEIEGFLDYPLEETIQIILYNKQSEFRQSNIGLIGTEESNIGGSTSIVGSKMFLYYEGSHEELDRQIRENLSRVLMSQMMYGGNWKDVLKNSTLLNIPEWYSEGLVHYIGEPTDARTQAFIRSGITTGDFKRFNRLEGEQSVYAGHALWKYIIDVYGESVVPNILYMTRISRNIESGFLFVLGVSLNTLTEDMIEYYKNTLQQSERNKKLPEINEFPGKPKFLELSNSIPEYERIEELARKDRRAIKKLNKLLGELPVKHKKRYVYSEFKLSPDAEHLAFVTHEMGQYKIWLYNLNSGKLKRIFKKEYKLQRIEDRSFPKLAWHPSSVLLTFTLERKGRAMLGNYNVDDKKVQTKELFRIDKVTHLSYSDDGRQMIFSGVKEGQSDLYLYQVIGNNQQQITDDIYDDLQPSFIRNSSAVIFASNRPDDTLRTDVPIDHYDLNKDIYVYRLGISSLLERITNTPNIDENDPSEYSDESYTFLSNELGNENRYIAEIDSTISRIDTTVHYRYFTVSNPISNFALSPLEYDYNPKTGNFGMLFYMNGGFKYVKSNRAEDDVSGVSFESTEGETSTVKVKDKEVLVIPKDDEHKEVDINNYVFKDEVRDYEYEKETIRLDETGPVSFEEESDSASAFLLPKSRNYRLNFVTDHVVTQIDNSYINQFYQIFSGPSLAYPGLSFNMQLGILDLFEDYKISGGIRAAGNLENSDFMLSFENLSERMDKKITVQRQGNRQLSEFQITQLQTYFLNYQLSYPINELFAVKGSLIYRNDRIVALSTDPRNLSEANRTNNTGGVKLELIFDNTISKGLNLYNGTRYKVWSEYYQEPTVEQSSMLVLGADFRHYQKIHHDLIFALRIAGSTSLLDRKVIHYLGGVDSWLFYRVDDSTEISDEQGYFYQTVATPVRGFYLNSRNGNSFAVANMEVRWPIFKYFIHKPIKSDFIQNFQIIAFGDVGSAWTGLHPYSEDNEFNTSVIQQNPITVTIENNREPIVYGYGFGLRSRLLGYFMRADWAWGVDDGVILPRVFYLSLGMDF